MNLVMILSVDQSKGICEDLCNEILIKRYSSHFLSAQPIFSPNVLALNVGSCMP